ncbi:immunoglobulin-binding protein 1 [Diretmus argenteus]
MAECENRDDDVRRPSVSGAEPVKLSELLDRGWKVFEDVDSTNDPVGSNHVQVKVRRGITALEEASRMAAQLHLFSHNEELEELATSDLKYLLLPALLGALTMKLTGRDRRLDLVQTARVYYHDFLTRCQQYDVAHFHLPKSVVGNNLEEESEHSTTQSPVSQPDLVAMAAQRRAKIEQYRQKKETEARLAEVRRVVDSGQADEDAVRDFYRLTMRKWISVCLEEIDSIDQEVEILKRMEMMKQSSAELPPQRKQPERPPIKPFILTKDAVQAKVFGAGYPSLATMTVDDWYEQHRKHGALPDQGIPSRPAEEDIDAQERQEEDNENRVDRDDEEALQKARDWDDWKDTHRRGYGNRHNMG